MPADYYELLGLNRGATVAELKAAYRRLAREHHPDANNGDTSSEAIFKEISEAYAVLSDPEARERYDRFGHNGVKAGAGGFDFDLGSIFDSFFGHDPFGGSNRRGPAGPPPGDDQEVVVRLKFAEAIFGTEATVNLRSAVRCDKCDGEGTAPGTTRSRCGVCDGAGQVRQVRNSVFGQMVTAAPCNHCRGLGEQIDSPCKSCRGGGVRTEKVTHTLTVPPGVEPGSVLRAVGRGHAGARGGTSGDLFVHLEMESSKTFAREGQNLIAELSITMLQAALGARVSFETLDGRDGTEKVVIKPGTQPGDMLRLRGLGVPRSNGRGRGDLHLFVKIEIPRKLTSKQTDLLAKVAQELGDQTDQDLADQDLAGAEAEADAIPA